MISQNRAIAKRCCKNNQVGDYKDASGTLRERGYTNKTHLFLRNATRTWVQKLLKHLLRFIIHSETENPEDGSRIRIFNFWRYLIEREFDITIICGKLTPRRNLKPLFSP
jgi:hypothetical protein